MIVSSIDRMILRNLRAKFKQNCKIMLSLIDGTKTMIEFYRPLSEGFNSLAIFTRCHEFLSFVGCEFCVASFNLQHLKQHLKVLLVSIINENKMLLVLL